MASIGAQFVAVSATAGTPILVKSAEVVSTPATPQTLISETVPVGKIWKLLSTVVVHRGHATYEITVNGERIGKGATGPGESNVRFQFDPYYPAAAGDIIEVIFTHKISPPMDVQAFLMMVEADE